MRLREMDAMSNSHLIIDQKTKRLYDPVGESPLSVTQPLEESFAELSLPAALGSIGKHFFSPYRHTGKGAKTVLAFSIALVGTLVAAVFQEPVSSVGESSLTLLPEMSFVAEAPSLLLITFCTLLVVLFAEVEGKKVGKEKDVSSGRLKPKPANVAFSG